MQRQEEAEVEQRRHAAQRLALERGLGSVEDEAEVNLKPSIVGDTGLTDETQDATDSHDGDSGVKEGAIIHHSELPSPNHEISPLANSPPELPPSNTEPTPPGRPQSPKRDGAPEPKPPHESSQ